MPDPPQSDRFKAEMPQIPGVPAAGVPRPAAVVNPALRRVAGLVGVLVLCLLGALWLLRPKHAEAPAAAPPPQIEVPAPVADTAPVVPRATVANPVIATVTEMAKPWSSKEFYFVNHLSSENIPALLIRLSSGSANQPEGYWALAMRAQFGNCQLEYLDAAKIKEEYDFHAAKHPMVGNPCSRTVFDPLKMTNIPGNFWVRGGIAQGSDVRPPLGIELKIQGKNILAIRME